MSQNHDRQNMVTFLLTRITTWAVIIPMTNYMLQSGSLIKSIAWILVTSVFGFGLWNALPHWLIMSESSRLKTFLTRVSNAASHWLLDFVWGISIIAAFMLHRDYAWAYIAILAAHNIGKLAFRIAVLREQHNQGSSW